jgi:hypothetical protein
VNQEQHKPKMKNWKEKQFGKPPAEHLKRPGQERGRWYHAMTGRGSESPPHRTRASMHAGEF